MPKHDPILRAFGNRVRSIRKEKNLSQERVAERADIDPTYISGIERGLRNPGLKNVVRIAKALGVRACDLCKGVEA
jgi:transcriptional regulator with XRE-family HTH domain